MSEQDTPRLTRRDRWIFALIGAGIVAILVVANAHLLHVALATELDCVPHLKAPDESGTVYRAAKSAC